MIYEFIALRISMISLNLLGFSTSMNIRLTASSKSPRDKAQFLCIKAWMDAKSAVVILAISLPYHAWFIRFLRASARSIGQYYHGFTKSKTLEFGAA